MQFLSYSLFLFVLVFCPLAFGTVENWSRFVLETATTVSLLLLCFHLFSKKKTFLQVPGTTPLFLLLAWMLLQLLPLPISFVKVVSPATLDIYRPFLELDPSRKWIHLTVNTKATLQMFFTFASYALFYFLTVYHLSNRIRLKQTVVIVATLGSLIAVEAILQKLTSPNAIYWFRTTPSGTPIGPWVYSNHFAGFMEMLFPLVVAMFLIYRPQVQYDKNLKNKFIAAFTMPGANRYLLLGTGAVLIAVAILLSLSRGGIITLSIALLFFTVFSARATRDKRTKWFFFLTISTVLIITWLGWEPIMDKFGNIWGEKGLDTSGRLPVLLDSINIFKTHPLFGTGFGTFIETYPGVRTVPGEALFDHAHNDYIELLTDGGILGFVLCGWFVLSVLTTSLRTLYRRRERYSILLTSGALTGLLALLFHSLVDFQMYNGANALYFFFFCGLAVSGANTRLQYRTRPTLLPAGHSSAAILPVLLASFLLITAMSSTNRQYKAARLTAPLQSIFLNQNIVPARLQEIHSLYSQAAEMGPLEARYRSGMGHVSLFLNKREQARKEFFQACMLQPMSGIYLQQLGLSLDSLKEHRKEQIIALGLDREPLIIERSLTYADWLIAEKRRTEALKVLDRALKKIPDKTLNLAGYIIAQKFSREEVEAALSPVPSTWYALGRTMEKKKQLDEAEWYYLKTIEDVGEGEILPGYFSSLYNLYQRQGKKDKAVAILRKAIEYLPEHAPFRVQLGDYYRQQGINYRAAEEYQQAVNLDPRYKAARQRLEDISLP